MKTKPAILIVVLLAIALITGGLFYSGNHETKAKPMAAISAGLPDFNQFNIVASGHFSLTKPANSLTAQYSINYPVAQSVNSYLMVYTLVGLLWTGTPYYEFTTGGINNLAIYSGSYYTGGYVNIDTPNSGVAGSLYGTQITKAFVWFMIQPKVDIVQ